VSVQRHKLSVNDQRAFLGGIGDWCSLRLFVLMSVCSVDVVCSVNVVCCSMLCGMVVAVSEILRSGVNE